MSQSNRRADWNQWRSVWCQKENSKTSRDGQVKSLLRLNNGNILWRRSGDRLIPAGQLFSIRYNFYFSWQTEPYGAALHLHYCRHVVASYHRPLSWSNRKYTSHYTHGQSPCDTGSIAHALDILLHRVDLSDWAFKKWAPTKGGRPHY